MLSQASISCFPSLGNSLSLSLSSLFLSLPFSAWSLPLSFYFFSLPFRVLTHSSLFRRIGLLPLSFLFHPLLSCSLRFPIHSHCQSNLMCLNWRKWQVAESMQTANFSSIEKVTRKSFQAFIHAHFPFCLQIIALRFARLCAPANYAPSYYANVE